MEDEILKPTEPEEVEELPIDEPEPNEDVYIRMTRTVWAHQRRFINGHRYKLELITENQLTELKKFKSYEEV